MHALLVGATGATGKDLVELLLKDDDFQQVEVFVRRDLALQHEKLKIHIIDFDKPEEWEEAVQGDVLFSCLGTTLKAAGSKEAQWKIDYEYQLRFAQAASKNNVKHYVLVSSNNASANSLFFYSRMKGKLEEAIKRLSFAKLTIFKPPLLIRKKSDRVAEVLGLKVLQFVNKMGMLYSQKPLSTEILAKAMLNAAKRKDNGSVSLQGEEIWKGAETISI